MKYFLDTEFLEGPQKTLFGKTPPTIDLISIGIVCEDGREYYAVSKDFNLKEAWNRYQVKECYGAGFCQRPDECGKCLREDPCDSEKEYWIRENVLRPIFEQWAGKDGHWTKKDVTLGNWKFTYKNFKYFLKMNGKTNKEIVKDIIRFTRGYGNVYNPEAKHSNPEFYAYYADYDWVVFCWLFGRMIDLPEGFPMYCKDLKQIMDEVANYYLEKTIKEPIVSSDWHDNYAVDNLKRHKYYPKQEKEHNALDDAKWNRKLHFFLQQILNQIK